MNQRPESRLSPDQLFGESDRYEEMLERGIRLSGNDQHFFIRGRVTDMLNQLPRDFSPRRILDFGCGIGHTTAYLAQVFPTAEVVGIDQSGKAIARARATYTRSRVWFTTEGGRREKEETLESGAFDLCYVNGVFHHIAPSQRLAVLRRIYEMLRPGACLALFENNPLNPGTRMVMRRIPFDRDAIPLFPWECRKLVISVGFSAVTPMRFLFYFPHALRCLRFVEPGLARMPLGAQYYVLVRKA